MEVTDLAVLRRSIVPATVAAGQAVRREDGRGPPAQHGIGAARTARSVASQDGRRQRARGTAADAVVDHMVPTSVPRTTGGLLILSSVLVVLLALFRSWPPPRRHSGSCFNSGRRFSGTCRACRSRITRHMEAATRRTASVTILVSLGAIGYVTFRFDWQLALIALAISPVLF